MANFLEFFATGKNRVYINLDRVLFVRATDKDNMTRLYFSDKDYITVNEPYGEVVMRIITRQHTGVMPNAEYRG